MSASLVWATVRAVSKRKLQPTWTALTLVGVKFSVWTRGCNGLSYTLTYTKTKGDSDEVVQDGVRDQQVVHPLFPLLALLFEKCEQSTQGSEGTTSASFDVDIENFVRKQEKEGKPFFCEDPETDNLMVKAIQVLRIHLLELEKVNELCKDFCSRYIACLKTKMNSETLLSGEPGSPYSPVQSQVGGTVYQPVTVVTPQGQVVTQALSPGTIRIQNSQLASGHLDLATTVPGAVVTITTPVNMNVDSLQSLSSDGATLAVQQVMMAGQSEDESVDSTEDDGGALAPTHISGLVLESSGSLQ
ncbi:Homeobox protein PKNOX1 [Tupaia chinensis]|uniref:Homeobox protein PKNOX1 n=1 Tax=Tupaia chinensis TaxID=246437 RepID=L8Y7I6_TUPCH|nr:Homeobox protein PKNOX1 [Tupaia chinensis]